jgi:hypothetical protein
MRRWTNAQNVPSNMGENRHDTNIKGDDSEYTFDDESDDTPMTISPRMYPVNSWSSFFKRTAPHPILCGKDGIINILPDHPHEGEVLGAGDIDLNATYDTANASNVAEFPTKNGVQVLPEIIAWAHVQDDHQSSDFKGLVNAKSFGAIGAYDGHEVDVGRVVVDSTWHHWFDVNLIGRPVGALDSSPHNASNPKTLGFEASPDGRAALERIYNYFRNVALWCTTKEKQRCMFLRSVWGVVVRYPAAELMSPKLSLLVLGGFAHDAIGRKASQCTRTRWIRDWFLHEIHPFLEKLPEACLSCPPSELIEKYVLGGITRLMLEEAYDYRDKGREEIDEKHLAEIMIKGVNIGLEGLTQDLAKSQRNLDQMMKSLKRAQKYMPEANDFLMK